MGATELLKVLFLKPSKILKKIHKSLNFEALQTSVIFILGERSIQTFLLHRWNMSNKRGYVQNLFESKIEGSR